MIKLALCLAIGLYLAVALYLYVSQRSILFLPATERVSPRDAGLSGVEELTLTTPDGETLVAWHAAPREGRPVILFLHGNAGSIGERPKRFEAYRERGFGVLYLSFRGYGGSSGSPSEAGLVRDALTAYDWLAARGHPAKGIVLVGESLGSGVAVQLAGLRSVGAVALEAPFTSIVGIAAELYWYLPVRLLLKDTFDSAAHIAKLRAPLLISHGEDDMLVPYAMGRTLFAAAPEPKEFFTLTGAGHEAIADPAVWAREMAFFERVAVAESTPGG